MNAKGGTLLIGVDPNRQVLGLENDYKCFNKDPNRDGFEQKLTGVMGSELGKDVTASVTASFIDVEGKDICWVRVEPSFRPVYVEQNGDFKFYVRLGNTTQPMNVKESADYITHRWGAK
jgi:predicted HTH transcriptional regulator